MANKLRSLTGATAMGLASLLGPAKSDGAVVVNYTADQSAVVSAPIYGLGATDSDYLLTHSGDWSIIDKNVSGN